MGNYSFKTTGLPEPVNGVIEGHNFTQGNPHTAIYSSRTGLTFKNCNLINCDIPEDSILISCNRGHMTFCGNLHPRLVEKGIIQPCDINCSHVIEVDAITIDGVAIDTNYSYEDRAI